ncbi:MAG: IS1380 family transposase [Planctomycetota bacterium]
MVHDLQPALFDFFPGSTVEIRQVDEHVSCDGGLVAFRELDHKLQLTQSFAKAISDARTDPTHSLLSVIRQRIFGIIGGYEDQNDHDTLRSDPVFKLIADRTVQDRDLASQPTISRVENAVTPADLLALEDWFINAFVDSFDEPPSKLTLDIDTFADPTHGEQQLTFFNGFYGQYMYQERVITCAENEQVVLPSLLFGTANVALAADDDLLRVIDALRKRYPNVEVHVRADSGFAKPYIYEALESRPGVTYSIGYQMNVQMREFTDELKCVAESAFEQTGEEQRRFMHRRHRARSWTRERDLVFKCEVTREGTNRRVVVTNRAGAEQYPDGVYQEYGDRGESENRNKELSLDLFAGRLSDHRYMANLFRMMLHCVSYNLLAKLRGIVSDPLEQPEDFDGIPFEACSDLHKRTYRNRNRRHDPLGRGQAMTWRMLIVKVAGRVELLSRKVRLLIPSSWPHWRYLHRVSVALSGYRASG